MRVFIVIVSLLFAGQVIGQDCYSDSTQTEFGFYPKNMKQAYLDSAYSETITIFANDTIQFFGQDIKVDSVELISLKGLPTGFTNSCYPSNCRVNGGEMFCIKVEGNPVSSSLIGSYPITIRYRAYGFGTSAPEDENYDTLIVNDKYVAPVGVRSESVHFEVRYVNGLNQIEIGSTTNGPVSLTLIDVLGNVTYNSNTALNTGFNSISLDYANIKSGIYFLNIESGQHSITQKLLVAPN